MIRKYLLKGVMASVVMWANLSCAADMPSMVDRHIFTPDNTMEQKQDAAPVDSVDLTKDLQFTGVIIVNGKKQAILTDAGKTDKDKKKQLAVVGDQIKGMTLTEIGPNYVLLATKESTSRLKLFRGTKNRPAPVEYAQTDNAANAAPQNPAAAQPQQGPGVKNKPMPPGAVTPQSPMPPNANPGIFGGAGNPDVQMQPAPNAGSNPFADAIKRAAEQNAASGNAGGPAANPFTSMGN